MSVLQYAVEVLKVKQVIVMGHYGCGGVKAAMSNQPHGLIDKWLRNIKDVIRSHKDELNQIEDAELRFNRLIELNVEEQVFNIFKTSIIQRAWASGHEVKIHGWVYAINSGLIKDLHIEQSPLWEKIEQLYEFDYTGNASDVTYHPLTTQDPFCRQILSPKFPIETVDVRMSRCNSYDPAHLLLQPASNVHFMTNIKEMLSSGNPDETAADSKISDFITSAKDLNASSSFIRQLSDLPEEEIIAHVTETLKHPLRKMRKSFAKMPFEIEELEASETELDEEFEVNNK